MRILFFNHNHEGYGTYWRCLHLARGLVARGHEVTLVCASGRDFDLGIRERTEAGVRILTTPRVRTKWSVHHTGQLLRTLIYGVLAARYKADVMMAFAVAQPTTAMAAWVASKRKKVCLVVDWDDDWEGGMAGAHGTAIAWLVRKLERNVPKLAQRITVASPWLLQRAQNLGFAAKTTLLPNGYWARAEINGEWGMRNAEFTPLFVAVGNYFPGWSDWVRVLTEARRVVPELKVVLLGGVPKEPLPDFIEARGFVPEAEVEQWLLQANAALLPMEDTVFDRSRWPIRLGSYLRTGVPIVSNAVGAVAEVLSQQPGHWVVSIRPDDTWTTALVQSCQTWKRMEETEAIRRLEWPRLAERLEDVFRAS